jgi:hypothetical protein
MIYSHFIKIRETIKNWPRIRYYQTGAEIRGIAWDPSTPHTLFVGSRNGNVHMITFDVSLTKVCGSSSP